MFLNEDAFIPLVPRVGDSYLGGVWRTCASFSWTRREHISVLETRAAVATIALEASQVAQHHRHLLVLSDSVACILGGGKGRSSKPGMCRALRQLAAVCLAASLTCHFRWVPSELNVADGPSRRGLRYEKVQRGGYGASTQRSPSSPARRGTARAARRRGRTETVPDGVVTAGVPAAPRPPREEPSRGQDARRGSRTETVPDGVLPAGAFATRERAPQPRAHLSKAVRGMPAWDCQGLES